MRWKGRRGSRNIEDRRGAATSRWTRPLQLPGGFGRGGFGRGSVGSSGGYARRSRARGVGGLAVVAFVLIALFFGVDPASLLNGSPEVTAPPTVGTPTARSPEEQELSEFVSVVLADTEVIWHRLFAERSGRYDEPKLVLFSGAVQSACGFAQSATGPFYCPGDQRIYIDLSFYRDLKNKLGAPGDFAQAYVIAHEVAHHVQNLLGISEKVQTLRQQGSQTEANALSVRMELQADCFAGVWAHHADQQLQVIEAGDIDEALNAASAIGDDRLQQRSGRAAVPDSFTHGSSAQRVHWFKRGLANGDVPSCDTFSADDL